MGHWFIKNNWCYTLMSVFLMSNMIFATKILQTGDKSIIRSMIDIDQNIANRNLTQLNFQNYVQNHFHFSEKTMVGKFSIFNS